MTKIDKSTGFLFDREQQIAVKTEWKIRKKQFAQKENIGWKFDWKRIYTQYQIYELFVLGCDEVQGRLAITIEREGVIIQNIESAPHNYGRSGRYDWVGEHLCAIACMISYNIGKDGFCALRPKTKLIKYYIENMHATLINNFLMFIEEPAAKYLIDKFLLGKGDSHE